MSKKSQARRIRDAFVSNNNGWDELLRLYGNYQSQLNEMVGGITTFLSIKGIDDFLTDVEKVHLARAMNAFNKDTVNFQARLTEVYGRHKHMTGKIRIDEQNKDQVYDEYNKAVLCYEAYESYRNDFDRIVFPVYRDVMGVIRACELRIQTQAEKDRQTREAALAKQNQEGEINV